VRATVDFAVEHKIDTIQMMMLTTLPGTSFDTQMRIDGRVLTDDYSLYDGHHCIIAPKNMTPYELQMETWKGMLRFYSSQGWLSRFNRQIAFNLGRIAKLLLTEWRFTTSLPQIVGLSIRGRHTDAFKLLRSRLSPAGVRSMYDLFGIAIFRKYGRGQLLKFSDQADSMKHLDVIRTLPAWTPPPAPKSHPSLQVIG
jgi:hypothetical protein